MFSFLGFIFIFVLILIFFGLTIIGSVLRALFGFGRRNTSDRAPSGDEANRSARPGDTEPSAKRKKIFDDDEGEYVEFEEVKKNKE